MGDDDDVAGADLDRVIRGQPERDDLATADHAIAEFAQMPGLLRGGPAQDICGVAHQQAHPFRSDHPTNSENPAGMIG